MSKLEECILGDLVEFQRGYDLPKSKFVEGKYPVQSSNGILGYHNEYKVEGPGITIGRSGTVGNPHLIRENFFPHNTSLFVKEFKGNDIEYIYYLLQYLDLGNQKSGSGVPTMNRNHLHPIKIRAYRDKTCQQRTIKILSLIDKKIQINNQINQELEVMAKTLYDYWFVQFDFPDQNGKPYKSSGGKMVYNPELKREIPVRWGVEKLSSLLEIGRETINPMKTPKEEFKYYSIPEYDVSGSFSYELGETIRSNKFIVEKSDLLVSKLNPWFNRVVYNLEENAISSTEFIVWKTFNRFEKNFLYQVATSKEFIEYCTRFTTGTSNSHKRVSPDIMVGFQIPFEKTYIQKFGEITDSIRTQVLQNNVQNQELTQLRDWLLPMLMNGQVKVE
ncbi:restriction endonuclease subunit S [Streptococcus oralis]|uniref:Type I restriction modification DNA specificity domain protein n=1 Tax=Streptococcus oralis ATCC 49296 TaxID=888049 RepID=E6KL52_STROR|nr:restriction endonuclease subunit S [Streptococcus oralis]EFU63302.1 type I restriction modification DNA specificity domain protein [Streptococcus oralis ATCC 49296]